MHYAVTANQCPRRDVTGSVSGIRLSLVQMEEQVSTGAALDYPGRR